MNELKVYKFLGIDEVYPDANLGSEYYLKSEVDKMIKDIVKGASSMFREFSMCRGLDTKSPLGRIADVAFKHWTGVERTLSNNRQLRLDKANLLRSNEDLHVQLKSQTTGRLNDKIEYNLDIRHQKYKRCLAMAKRCGDAYDKWMMRKANAITLSKDGIKYYHQAQWKVSHYMRWQKALAELAEKFK